MPSAHAAGHMVLVTIYALSPYHIEPPETGCTVCHTVRWELPRR